MNSTIATRFSQSFSFDEEYRAAIERNYNRLLGVYFEGDQYKADLVLSIVIIVSSYWLFGALDTLIEVFEWPKWILRYKIQSTSQVNFSNLCRLLPQVLLNQLLGLMLTVLGVELRYLLFVPNNHVPSLIRLIYELAMASVLREIAFYYSHRLLHHPRIYRHIHKQHHEWQSPIAMVAIYCHPIEHLLSNVFPTMLGPLVLQMHGITLYLWELWVIFYSMSHHCGYHLPFFPSPVFHNFHHSRSTGNYGILGFLDWFHGTDKAFRNSIYYNLDRIYITVTPPKDMPQKLE